MFKTMIKLIIIYLAIFATITFSSKEESRGRVIKNSKNDTGSESRERIIGTRKSKNYNNVRKDILDSISSRADDDSDVSKDRRTGSSSSRTSSQRETSNKRSSKSKNNDEYSCGGKVTVYTSAEIMSPSYPSKYPPNTDCKWDIKAQNGQTIKVEIFKLNIENNDNCKFDYLDIKGVRKLCGKVSDSIVNINSSTAEIRFHSDANNEDYGFHIRVLTEANDCLSQMNVSSYAFITSPKYPANYDDSTDCWTLIRTDISTTLVITFDVLKLEYDTQCAYDYLEIFDSQHPNNSLGKYCEKPDNVTLSLQSSRNILLLHFHSDQLLNNKGFRAEVTTARSSISETGCSWKVNWVNMTLNSPHFPSNYPPNLNCELTLSSPTKEDKIVILFNWIHLETNSKCENSDRLEIWEDNEKTPKRVLCGRKTQPFKYVSRSRTVKLVFISDGFAEFPGFSARITHLNSNNKAEPRVGEKLMRAPQNASVVIGSSHILHCEPLTNDKVRWFKEDKVIKDGVSSDGRTIIIREFTSSSAGRYTCKFGKEHREAWLRVRKTNCNSIIFRKRPKDMSISEGELAVLECNVADSRVPIKWERDGKIVSNNSRVTQLHNGFLLMDPAKSDDSGIYFCVANAGSNDCLVKSGARLSVNQRVNVNTVCGISRVNEPKLISDVSKIIGGTEATKSAFPWHVMFWDYRRKAFCGGALLNERWVLTAAHCFESGSENAIEIKLGKYDQTLTEDTEIGAKIAEVIRHPDFSRETFDNDIALVRLSQHITFSPHIIPICLTDKKERTQVDDYFLKPNSAIRIGHVTGWGQLKENGPQPRYLQELRVPIVEANKCRASTAFKVTTNMFCAGYGKEVLGDACKGDSGGPFVVPFRSKWIMLGIVSWGEGCGRTGKYGFYTRVNNYLDWINAIIKL